MRKVYSLAFAVLLTLTAPGTRFAMADDASVAVELRPSSVVLTARGRSNLESIVKNYRKELVVVQPTEVAELMDTLGRCTVTLQGWNKDEFLRNWQEAESDVNSTTKRILEQAFPLRAGDHPLVNIQPQTKGALSKEAQEFLEKAQQRGVKITEIEVQGIKGIPVVDPEVLAGSKLVSDDDIAEALSSYIVGALPRLYERLSATPSKCWSANQVRLIQERVLPTISSVRSKYSDDKFEQIECGKVGASSRFTVPLTKLSERVVKASRYGPWPYGPAGFYFSKSWFMRNAVGQMYARESGKYRENLSVDVADYTCGKP